jgi:MEMO1 family protein
MRGIPELHGVLKLSHARNAMKAISDLRPSPIAGTWYEGDPERLARQVDKYIGEARLPELAGQVVALIAPHAGHIYSGPTAGYAFRAVQGQTFDLVAVASPLHAFHPATLLTTAHRAYVTPLGPVWLDEPALDAFERALFSGAGQPDLQLARLINDQEHALEIELPFLQRALAGEFKLLPLMLRDRRPAVLRRVGAALAACLSGKRALLLASTDLSHFYPEHVAGRLDEEMLRRVAAFAPEKVLEAEELETGFACGVSAVAAVLWAARELGANKVEILHHSTSADQTGDRRQVVGYAAAAVLKQP